MDSTGAQGGGNQVNDCGGWTSSAPNSYVGTLWEIQSPAMTPSAETQYCNVANYVLCCN